MINFFSSFVDNETVAFSTVSGILLSLQDIGMEISKRRHGGNTINAYAVSGKHDLHILKKYLACRRSAAKQSLFPATSRDKDKRCGSFLTHFEI